MLVKVDWGFDDPQSDLCPSLCAGSAFAALPASGSVSLGGGGGSVEPRLTLTNVPRNGPPQAHWNTLEQVSFSFFSICVRFLVWASFPYFFFFTLSFPAYDSLARSAGPSSTHAPCTFASPLFSLISFVFNYCSVSIAVMINTWCTMLLPYVVYRCVRVWHVLFFF